MISLFEKRLKRMKRELTDLKCAHQRGLGTIRFFKASCTSAIAANTSALFEANIAQDEPTWPIFSIYASGPIGHAGIINVYEYDQTATRIRFYVQTSSATTVTVTVVSSSQLSGVTRA